MRSKINFLNRIIRSKISSMRVPWHRFVRRQRIIPWPRIISWLRFEPCQIIILCSVATIGRVTKLLPSPPDTIFINLKLNPWSPDQSSAHIVCPIFGFQSCHPLWVLLDKMMLPWVYVPKMDTGNSGGLEPEDFMVFGFSGNNCRTTVRFLVLITAPVDT